MLAASVVVVKLPSANGLITKPEGASVIVVALGVYPGAVGLSCAVPVPSSAWMNNEVDDDDEPALIGSTT